MSQPALQPVSSVCLLLSALWFVRLTGWRSASWWHIQKWDHFPSAEVCFGWRGYKVHRLKQEEMFRKMRNKVAHSTYRIYYKYYLTSCFCFGAKVCLPPWITGINQKEWILTYSRLDGSQVELLFDLHHLSKEIKFGGEKKVGFAHCFCILHRDPWAFYAGWNTWKDIFLKPSITCGNPLFYMLVTPSLLNAYWCDAARISLSIKLSDQWGLVSAGILCWWSFCR